MYKQFKIECRNLCSAAAFQAKAGKTLNFKEALLGEACSSTIMLASACRVFTISSAVLQQMLQESPQLQQTLLKDVSQQLAVSQAASQVSSQPQQLPPC